MKTKQKEKKGRPLNDGESAGKRSKKLVSKGRGKSGGIVIGIQDNHSVLQSWKKWMEEEGFSSEGVCAPDVENIIKQLRLVMKHKKVIATIMDFMFRGQENASDIFFRMKGSEIKGLGKVFLTSNGDDSVPPLKNLILSADLRFIGAPSKANIVGALRSLRVDGSRSF